MARRSLARIRNIGIVAHINTGKTTLTERFLFRSGKQRYMGEVDEGTATMDFMKEEQERGISISAAVTSVDWRGFHINLIDTPGHVDFTAEVERSLRVLDGVVVVVDGVRGVESQTEIIWRQVQEHGVPAVVFINKMDRATADYEESLISLSDRLDVTAVPMVVPLREDGELVGLLDLIDSTSIGDTAVDPTAFEASRLAVTEACADFDDAITEDFIEGRPVDAERLHRAVRRGTVAGGIVPVFCGSALLNRGVDWLLTAVCRYLPSPLDRPVVPKEGGPVVVDEDAPLCGLVFKIQFGSADVAQYLHAGADSEPCLHFVRLYSGQLREGELIRGSRHDGPIHVQSIWRISAGDHEKVLEVGAGDVAALVVDRDLRTGETIYAPGSPISLESVNFPSPVLTARVEAVQDADYEEIKAAAERLCREDPTLVLGRDAETGAPLVSGMGELHLQVFEQRLVAATGHHLRLSAPRVLLHETLRRPAVATAECWRHLEGRDLSARVELSAEPRPGTGPATVGDVAVPDQGVRRMLRRLLQAQLRSGMSGPTPACDLRVHITAIEGEIEGSLGEAVCGEAVAIACRKLAAAGGSVTLEPYVDCAVSCPADAVSSALADLRARGAEIAEVTSADGRGEVRGELPLAQVLGYATRLRSLTRGLGTVHLRPVGLRPAGASNGSKASREAEKY